LGLKTWPNRSAILLKMEKKVWTVNAGAVQGLTQDAILAVYPSIRDNPGAKEPVGFVQVTALAPTSARVKQCGYGGKEAVKADALPEQGRCDVLTQSFGDMKLRLALGKAEDPAHAKLLQELAAGLSKEMRTMVKL